MDDFSETPVSISELRSARDHDMRSWTPRDVLVSLLRDIDSGKADIDVVFVAYRNRKDSDTGKIGFAVSGGDPAEAVGVAHLSINRFIVLGSEP